VAAVAALASSDAVRPSLAQETSTGVPHLCCSLESRSGAGASATTEHACAALLLWSGKGKMLGVFPRT
jgi:hypothetical protein